MKKIFFVLALLPFLTKAQDTIAMKTGVPIPALVLELTPETVRYKRFSNVDGPDYTAQKSSISYIRYKNGTKENIDSLYQIAENAGRNNAVNKRMDGVAMYQKGDQDARMYYNSPCGAVGTGVTSFACGCLGLIPAIACSSAPPKTQNLKYPSQQLFSDPDYRRGYEHRAKKIKQKKVWTAFGIGLAAGAVVGAVIYNNQ